MVSWYWERNQASVFFELVIAIRISRKEDCFKKYLNSVSHP